MGSRAESTQNDIVSSVEKLLKAYDGIRGKPRTNFPVPFWDLVAITASDVAQKEAYNQQINNKLKKGELPVGVPYLVFSDPPGPRVGCGGSTMYVITELEKKYGSALKEWRVLLLNAGGQSQRLPSASVLGKIFSPLPMGRPMYYQTLDLALALYLPFLERMSPGYFHVSSDCIVLYDLDDTDDWTFTKSGLTALAHPSSLQIGTGHGVFVLKDKPTDKTKISPKKAEFRECVQVLQKPSIGQMNEAGAVQDPGEGQEPFVYTDSCFFIDHDFAGKLAEFYRQESPLKCEIDGYGDFMQPLGLRASIDFTLNTANVADVEPDLIPTRQKIFHLLKGTPLHVVALNTSNFYHYGTFGEYIYHQCDDPVIAEQLSFEKFVFSTIKNTTESRISRSQGGCASDSSPLKKKRKPSVSTKGCVMHSLLMAGSESATRSIIEYSSFSIPVKLGTNCIISNCEYIEDQLAQVALPDNTFLHTVIVNHNGNVRYVPVVFNITDNLKKKVSLDQVGNLVYLGKPLMQVSEKLGLTTAADVFKKAGESKCYCLWQACLFPLQESMSEAFIFAFCLIQWLQMGSETEGSGSFVDRGLSQKVRFSMADIMLHKNIEAMLQFRNDLYRKIEQTKQIVSSSGTDLR